MKEGRSASVASRRGSGVGPERSRGTAVSRGAASRTYAEEKEEEMRDV